MKCAPAGKPALVRTFRRRISRCRFSKWGAVINCDFRQYMVSRRSVLKCAALSLGAPLVNRGLFSLFAHDDTEYSARTVDLVRGSTVIDMLGLLTLDYRKVSAWATEPDRF